MNSIKALINSNCIAVFSKSYCPYCKLAKDTLIKAGAQKMEVVELDLDGDGHGMQKALHELTGISTVPHVFIKQKYIGGGTDTAKLHENGELKSLLEICTRSNS